MPKGKRVRSAEVRWAGVGAVLLGTARLAGVLSHDRALARRTAAPRDHAGVGLYGLYGFDTQDVLKPVKAIAAELKANPEQDRRVLDDGRSLPTGLRGAGF